MVDAPFDEGNDGWDAMGSATPAPAMQMQMQDQTADDAFAEAAFPVSSPAVVIQSASGANQNLDDDLTEEEKEIVAQAAAYQDTLRAQVNERMVSEAGEKQARKTAGATAIQEWQKEREGQIGLRKQNNEEHERQFYAKREDERKGGNPWERVTENCDLTNQGVIAGGKDKSRMKQAMLNRKADNSAGGASMANFGSAKGGLL